jgi:hypothetical protein
VLGSGLNVQLGEPIVDATFRVGGD